LSLLINSLKLNTIEVEILWHSICFSMTRYIQKAK